MPPRHTHSDAPPAAPPPGACPLSCAPPPAPDPAVIPPRNTTSDARRAAPPAVACPFCGAAHAEVVSLFGTQLLLSQYRCRACHTYFEAVQSDEDASSIGAPVEL